MAGQQNGDSEMTTETTHKWSGMRWLSSEPGTTVQNCINKGCGAERTNRPEHLPTHFATCPHCGLNNAPANVRPCGNCGRLATEQPLAPLSEETTMAFNESVRDTAKWLASGGHPLLAKPHEHDRGGAVILGKCECGLDLETYPNHDCAVGTA